MMLNYDSGAAVTALPVAVAGGLLLEKRGEFRVASGAVIPNLGKIKRKSTDESGVARSIRGHITEVAKPLLSAAQVSKRWDSLLFEDGGIPFGAKFSCCFEGPSKFGQAQSLESSWQEHQALPRRQLVQSVRASCRCHTGACAGRTSREGAGPEWTWTMESMMSRMKQINMRSSGEFQLLASLQSWRAEAFLHKSCCVRTFVRSVCKSKGNTSTTHETDNQGMAKQGQDGPRIYSDLFYMSEAGVATAMLELKFSRSGRKTATALEQKGLTQYVVKFFAGFIQQTGVRRFINESDGEPAMKAKKDAAAKAPRRGREHWTGIASGRSPREW